ncbi:MAG: hypothetical protein FD174_3752 [Geobacteraceae bacterium]|nr:MAG: hypothetical protein FD174_3752 [Geobacteraceae bacterium]
MNTSVKTAVMLLLLSFVLFSLFFMKKSDRRIYPVLGIDVLQNVGVFEDHMDALEHWAEKGIRNAVLVNIDAHDDLKRVAPEKMEELKAAYHHKVKEPRTSEIGQDVYAPVTNGNFIHAAAKLGIVKKVIWIVPSSYNLFSDSGSQLAQLLKMYGFPDEDIKTFRIKNGCFIGDTDGIPLVICDIGSLPNLNEPILLSIDVDFFPSISNDNLKITNSVKQTFSALFNKGYAIRDAVVAYSVNEGFLGTCYRWVGDLVSDILRQPGIISHAALPDRYSVLQRADLLLVMERFDDLLNYFSPFLTRDGIDPAILMYAAKAYQRLGEMEKSFRCAERACLAENTYCYGLPELGSIVLDERGLDAAERFFVRGYDLRPKMDHGQFRFAMALKESGRAADAITYFNVFRDRFGSFPVDFYIAETFLLMGDETSAMRYYDSGRTELVKNPSVLAGFGNFKTIEKAAKFYEQKGFGRYASELRESIKFMDMR